MVCMPRIWKLEGMTCTERGSVGSRTVEVVRSGKTAVTSWHLPQSMRCVQAYYARPPMQACTTGASQAAAGAHLQVGVDAAEVRLLQLHANVLRDQVNGHHVVAPANGECI